MSIGTFVSASLELLEHEKYDAALSLACSAVDATAAKYFPSKNNNERNKCFLKDNMGVITTFGMPGLSAGGIRIKCENIRGIKTDNECMAGLEDIIYHVIRCGLIHECEMDQRLVFTKRTQLGDFDEKFRIPSAIVLGLIMSVVLSARNSSEILPGEHYAVFNGKKYNLNELWGKKESLKSKM